ncbi:NlpC/P60 family protein [Micromonospora sp. NPDC049559]|uniref:C40 family peptidase n=1 Tax=Micromonospora sp. NPDC049559 TaxID=3155923 RepID=UPI003433D6DF
MSSVRNLLRAVVLVGLSIGLITPAAAVRAAPSASELTKQINQKSAELEKIIESYNKLNGEIKTTKETAAQLSAKMAPLEQQLDVGRAQIGLLAANAYKTGRLQNAGALLDPAGAETLIDRLNSLDQLARERQRTLAGFDQTQRAYLDQKAQLDATLARQNAQAAQLSAGRKKIEGDLGKLYDMRKQAYGSATTPGSAYKGTIPKIAGSAGKAVTYAFNAIGKPYVYAADGPDSYDCSGLTMAAWKAAGKSLPHNAAQQWDVVAHISRGSLQPGDLVFYSGLGHVAIYVGSGKVIHAPQPGESVTQASVDMMTPYGYGRVR